MNDKFKLGDKVSTVDGTVLTIQKITNKGQYSMKEVPGFYDEEEVFLYVEPESLRDRFAMAALTGILAHPETGVDPKAIKEGCYKMADMMMEARK